MGRLAFVGNTSAVKVIGVPTGAMLTGVLMTTLVRLTGVTVMMRVAVTGVPPLLAVTVTTCGPSVVQVNVCVISSLSVMIGVTLPWLVADQL